MFTTFEAAKDWIESSIRFGDKLDLKRMELASKYLHHPEKQFKSIHVAGTNGKGSTTNYIKNIIKRHGYKVGIYTSPYVVKFNERIGINDAFILDDEIIEYANRIHDICEIILERHQEHVTFFEILTLMAFCYFADQAVDYAVIEVGLGGLLDATNIIIPEVSVITNISYDHMKQLGNTLESIAMNKLGIVKPGIPLVTTEKNPFLVPQFQATCRERNAAYQLADYDQASLVSLGETTTFTYRDHIFTIQLPGLHQIKNAVLAIDTFLCLAEKKNIAWDWRMITLGLQETTWPGRFEIFNHQIILDGAHNVGGIESLKTTIEALYPTKRKIGLFCMMKDKEHEKIIPLLDTLFDEFHFTQIDYKRSATAQELALESQHPQKFTHESIAQALDVCTNLKENDILIITGSLYFVSDIRPLLIKKYRA